MTELQKTEFDILVHLDAACSKLGIPYYLVCGSALGAVKYGGFIPWDDDIDVAMFRDDYEVFLKEAPKLLPEHLFLQNWHTDPACPQISSKLRNSKTAYIEESAANIAMHHGVFIDIFPLDGYPAGKLEQNLLELRKRIYVAMLQSACEYPRGNLGAMLCKICRLSGLVKHTDRVAKRYERMISSYPVAKSELVCNHANWQGKLDYSPKTHFANGFVANFEGLVVKIPKEYHLYLTQKYGEYSQDPPKAAQNGHHHYFVCDCNRAYTDFINEERRKNHEILEKRREE